MPLASWEGFRAGFAEVLWLLKKAETADALHVSGRSVSDQQIYLRSAIVLLAGHVEGFFKAVAEEHVDLIGTGSWERQLPGMRRYMALCALRHLQDAIEDAEDCKTATQIDKFRRSVILAGRWLTNPHRFTESTTRPQLSEFYRQKGAQALDTFLQNFHPAGSKFFPWLEARGFDRGRFWTVMEGLVFARNQIAHGKGEVSLTLAEVRSYAAVCIVLVRQTRIFMRSGGDP